MLRQGVFSVEICRNLEYYGIGLRCEEREERVKEIFMLAMILKTALPKKGIKVSKEYKDSEYLYKEDEMHINGNGTSKDIFFRIAHEMRHKWQLETDCEKYFKDYKGLDEVSLEEYGVQIAEVDANAFAMIMSVKLVDTMPLFIGRPDREREKIFKHAKQLAEIYNVSMPWDSIDKY